MMQPGCVGIPESQDCLSSEKVIFFVADSIASFSGQRRAKESKALERFRGIIKTSSQDL